MGKNEQAEVERLVDELFDAVQSSQGYAFISDGEMFNTKRQFFERIRGRLEHSRESVRIIRAFLHKHGGLKPNG